MPKRLAGFTVIELALFLILAGVVSFTGWYVYESSKKADESLSNSLIASSDIQTNTKAQKIVAVGDIVCDPGDPYRLVKNLGYCQDEATYQLTVKIDPDAVLALGDLQYNDGTLDKFKSHYNKSWGQLKSITYPVAGNHEYVTNGASGYFSYFGNRAGEPDKGYYSFDISTWHFIVLNSNCAQISGCGESSQQLEWLKQDLAASTRQACVAAFWHHPRFTSGKYLTDSASRNLSSAFWVELVNNHVEVVLNGHDHIYERFALQNSAGEADQKGPRQFTVGTGGKELYKRKAVVPNSEVLIDDSFGVLVIDLYLKAYRWQFISTEGKILDSGSQKCT
ncbi:MAG TPA: metallophosphoesterase [Candidatus Saccharimonadales bacterium]|nr:metallophosphoesterase [Candidatus Saccharimonadales bacterium]